MNNGPALRGNHGRVWFGVCFLDVKVAQCVWIKGSKPPGKLRLGILAHPFG